ncbi:MAG: hypothetical protein WCH43_11205, partial [Verrucomicrobiota bacterium]
MPASSPTTIQAEAETCLTTEVCDPVSIPDRTVEFVAMRADLTTTRITIAVTDPLNTGAPVCVLLHLTPA